MYYFCIVREFFCTNTNNLFLQNEKVFLFLACIAIGIGICSL